MDSFQIVINYDMTLNNGIIDTKIKQATNEINIKKFMEDFIDKHYHKREKK